MCNPFRKSIPRCRLKISLRSLWYEHKAKVEGWNISLLTLWTHRIPWAIISSFRSRWICRSIQSSIASSIISCKICFEIQKTCRLQNKGITTNFHVKHYTVTCGFLTLMKLDERSYESSVLSYNKTFFYINCSKIDMHVHTNIFPYEFLAAVCLDEKAYPIILLY